MNWANSEASNHKSLNLKAERQIAIARSARQLHLPNPTRLPEPVVEGLLMRVILACLDF